MVTSLHFTSRPHDPFDDSAVERQRRMGLLTETGGVEEGALAVLSRVYAGLFLDHLCDYYLDAETVTAACRSVVETAKLSGPQSALLELCMQYDGMHCPLPEPIWSIVGSDALLSPFISGFAACLTALSGGLEVMS